MIQNLKTAKPNIDFGFGTLNKETIVGNSVTVWLQTLYNQEAYNFQLNCSGTVTRISNYQYEVNFSTPGSYAVQMAITPKTKAASLLSNILFVNVTEQNG